MGSATQKIDSLESLSKYFTMPEKAVAKELGMCLTSLKKLCRSYGITRWPFRKLKSIQRTMAKVQDDAASSGMAAQLQAVGIVIAEGGSDASHAADDAKPQPVVRLVESEAAEKANTAGGKAAAGGDKKDGKRRKPYTVNGKTVMMTEEEKKLFSISMGDGGGLTLVVKPEPAVISAAASGSTPSTGMASSLPTSPGSSVSPGGPPSALYISASDTFVATPACFSCKAVGTSLHVRHWSELWTQVHLQQRLLEPLQGRSLSIIEGGLVAVLEFDNEKTAQRAELICRAAAKAAEENLKRPSSRTVSPPLQNAPSAKQLSQLGSLSKVLIEIPHDGVGGGASSDGSNGTGANAVSPGEHHAVPGVSPMYRLQPVSPNAAFPFGGGLFEDGPLTGLSMHQMGSNSMHLEMTTDMSGMSTLHALEHSQSNVHHSSTESSDQLLIASTPGGGSAPNSMGLLDSSINSHGIARAVGGARREASTEVLSGPVSVLGLMEDKGVVDLMEALKDENGATGDVDCKRLELSASVGDLGVDSRATVTGWMDT